MKGVDWTRLSTVSLSKACTGHTVSPVKVTPLPSQGPQVGPGQAFASYKLLGKSNERICSTANPQTLFGTEGRGKSPDPIALRVQRQPKLLCAPVQEAKAELPQRIYGNRCLRGKRIARFKEELLSHRQPLETDASKGKARFSWVKCAHSKDSWQRTGSVTP